MIHANRRGRVEIRSWCQLIGDALSMKRLVLARWSNALKLAVRRSWPPRHGVVVRDQRAEVETVPEVVTRRRSLMRVK